MAGKLQIAQEEEVQAIKLVKTLQSKLAAASAATAAMTADQALLAASLEKLNAREKELLDNKGFMEGKIPQRKPQTTNSKPQTANCTCNSQTTNCQFQLLPPPPHPPPQASALCA